MKPFWSRTTHSTPSSSQKQRPLDRLFHYVHNLHTSDRALFIIVGSALFISLLWSGIVINDMVSEDIPSHEGMVTEGIVGTPRFINPVLAVTRADRDLGALVYAGLARLDETGVIVPDVAETITVSDDGLVYNIIIRSDVRFHDNTELTAQDVAFTIQRIQDPGLASPLRASWDGVAVEVIGTHEINFVLPSAYAPFIENLTVGILPHHIWKEASNEEFPFSQYNSEPIGAGPYKVTAVKRDPAGIPQSYILTPYKHFYRTLPKIQTFTLNFYVNETKLIDAFNAGAIDTIAGLSPETIEKLDGIENTHNTLTTPLPRTFAVFFNQNKSAALRDPAVRQALDHVVDREELIDTVLSGYAQPLYSPVPHGFDADAIQDIEIDAATRMDEARAILRGGGWSINEDTGIWEKEIDEIRTELAFSISTANAPVFTATAEYLQATWGLLGAGVSIKQFEQSDLTQAIIRPRNYEALLFGTDLGRALDFYSFWHSSQRNDPGLNVALYANITTDAILESARTLRDEEERIDNYTRFEEEVKKEYPAVFLYQPLLTYILPRQVTGVTLEGVSEPFERFTQIHNWYMDIESVWPILNN